MHAARNITVFSLYPPPGTGLNAWMNTASRPHDAHASPADDPADFSALLIAVGHNRDRDAFARLFRHFAPRLKSFLIKGGATPSQAEELVQDTMLAIWNRAATYDPARANAGTWIFTIARNKRIDALRRGGRVEIDIDDAAFIADDASPRPDQAIMDTQQTRAVAEMIESLPPEQADVIRKSFFEDKTHMQIAAESNLPLGTVKSRIRLAMERLRPQLQKHMTGDAS